VRQFTERFRASSFQSWEKLTSFSRKPALSAIWFSFMRRASRDRFAAMLFFLRRAQYLSSFKSSGTNCSRKRKREREKEREKERIRRGRGGVSCIQVRGNSRHPTQSSVRPDIWRVLGEVARITSSNCGSPVSAIS